LAATTLAGSVAGMSAVAAAAPRSAQRFDQPSAIAVDQGHVWVANRGGNSVTEVSANGTWMRTVAASRDRFGAPDAIVADGPDLFVVNATGSLTEITEKSGAFVRSISGKAFSLKNPNAAVLDGADLWVTDGASNAVTEIRASDGSLVRVVKNSVKAPHGFDDPDAITVAGLDLWVANMKGGGSVTEINASTGSVVRTVNATADQLSAPDGVAFDGTHVWVTDSATNTLTELHGNGQLVQVVTNSSHNGNYGFNVPSVVLFHDKYVYVVSPAPGGAPMITQVAIKTGYSEWMMCNSNYAFQFLLPSGLAIDGANLWVANAGNNSLTEMNAETGVLVTRVT
jgi:hypothetical protein